MLYGHFHLRSILDAILMAFGSIFDMTGVGGGNFTDRRGVFAIFLFFFPDMSDTSELH